MWWGRPGYFWGGILVIVGALAMLANLGWLDNLEWNLVWPILLIAFGVWLIVARVLPGASTTYGGAVDRADTRDGVAKARLEIALGATRLDLRGASLGEQLYKAHLDHRGNPPEVHLDRISGTVRITQPDSWMFGGWGRIKLDVQVNDALPWEVDIDTGALRATVDLRTVPLVRFECDAGSSRLEVSLSRPTGEVPIRVEGGSVRARLRRPVGTAAKVTASGGSIRLIADGVRQGGFGSVSWQSPGGDSAPDRYDIRLAAGAVNAELEQA